MESKLMELIVEGKLVKKDIVVTQDYAPFSA